MKSDKELIKDFQGGNEDAFNILVKRHLPDTYGFFIKFTSDTVEAEDLAQDVFIKMMLKKYGGFGYTYILTHFKNRLLNIGVLDDQINEILINNPRNVFSFDNI